MHVQLGATGAGCGVGLEDDLEVAQAGDDLGLDNRARDGGMLAMVIVGAKEGVGEDPSGEGRRVLSVLKEL